MRQEHLRCCPQPTLQLFLLQLVRNLVLGAWCASTAVCLYGVCSGRAELLSGLERGWENRHTRSTMLNEESSRSHCVLTIKCVQVRALFADTHTTSAEVASASAARNML